MAKNYRLDKKTIAEAVKVYDKTVVQAWRAYLDAEKSYKEIMGSEKLPSSFLIQSDTEKGMGTALLAREEAIDAARLAYRKATDPMYCSPKSP